jgi:HAD superfamily hydrolase (TIGR01490 family)
MICYDWYMAVKRKKLAIFDIDGTIFRSSLLIELVEALIKERIFKPSVLKIYKKAKEKWLDRKGEYDDYIDAVVNAFRRNLKGVAYNDFLKVAKKVVASNKDRVYRFTRDLVKDLKKKKYYLLAISNSPQTMAKEFSNYLGFDKVYGRLYGLDDNNKFNGEIMFIDLISDKAKILKRAVEKENLTLNGSIGVGDTESDIRFLKLVDNPICFNPNKKLFNYAKKKKWSIVVERKNVIYKF